jgi:hypothetical protein
MVRRCHWISTSMSPEHVSSGAIPITRQLSAGDRDALIARLDRVRTISHNFGYGVGDDVDDLLAKYVRT